MSTTLRLDDFISPGDWFAFARHRHQGRTASALVHDHGFVEMYWIEYGSGIEVLPDRQIALQERSLRFVSAADRHGFLAAPEEDLHMVNVAFPAETWHSLLARYTPDLPDWYAGQVEARHHHLSRPEYTALARAGERLAAGPRTRLALETFLLQLAQIVIPLDPVTLSGGPPAWLAQAVTTMRDPRWFRRGPLAFARLTGRTQAHVSRAIRRWYGCTPTALTNQMRLDWAAAQLVAGATSIPALALDAGFPNLGHFYLQFAKRFATTPRRWRMRARQLAGG